MKKLRGLRINHGDKYVEIANAKRNPQKNTLLSLAGEINACYADFNRLARRGELFDLLSLQCDADEREALLSCYISRTKAGNLLLKDIRLNQEKTYQTVCPYCGILHSTTFDHYVPKDSFPEFSMYALNLLPCCDTCNRKKSEYWRNTQSCGIIHFYYDELPEETFLFCTLVYNGSRIPAISYSLDFPTTIDDDCTNVIQTHYDRLNLLERYNEEGGLFLSDIRKTIVLYFSRTRAELRITLNKHAAQLADDLGRNNYKVALIEALCDSDDFLNEMVP